MFLFKAWQAAPREMDSIQLTTHALSKNWVDSTHDSSNYEITDFASTR